MQCWPGSNKSHLLWLVGGITVFPAPPALQLTIKWSCDSLICSWSAARASVLLRSSMHTLLFFCRSSVCIFLHKMNCRSYHWLFYVSMLAPWQEGLSTSIFVSIMHFQLDLCSCMIYTFPENRVPSTEHVTALIVPSGIVAVKHWVVAEENGT